MTTTPTSGADDLPEALKHAEGLESFAEHLPAYGFDSKPLKEAAATIRRLHALLEAEDAAHCNTIEQRDEAEKLGTMLANAVAEHFRVEVGEYSNLNDPRLVALEILDGGYITDSDADRKIAALAAGQATTAQAVVPAGWNLVPTEPTQAMLDAVVTSMDDFLLGKEAEKQYREDWAAMLAAAPAQPVAQQGAAYAATPTSNYAGRVYEEGFLIGTCPLYTADQLRAFADATYALRASHGQAPAGATKPTEQQILEAAEKAGLWPNTVHSWIPAFHRYHKELAKAQPAPAQAAEPVAVVVPCYTPSGKRVALYSAKQDLPIGTKLYAAPQPSYTAQAADSVQEDAARYRWLREGNDAKHGAAWHVAVNLYGCEWDAAIDSARKQG